MDRDLAGLLEQILARLSSTVASACSSSASTLGFE